MQDLYTIVGIALTSELASKILEDFGHGGKIVFVKVTAYIACAYVALDVWWEGVRYVQTIFGV